MTEPDTVSGEGTSIRRPRLIVTVAAVVVALGTASFALGRCTRSTGTAATTGAAVMSPSSALSASTSVSTTTTASTTTTTTSSTSTTVATTTTSLASTSPSNNVYPIAAGASSQYPRSHHDYPAADIFTSCGNTFVAPAAGRVDEVSLVDTWSSKVNDGATRGGLSVSIVGDDGVRYYGSHLRLVLPTVRPGTRVTVGQPLGQVGDTGSAKGTGCHLHFGISAPCGPGDWQRRRGQFWPQKYLDAWKAGRQLSAVPELSKSPC
jgi:murein DD-endopeptidase MepM/ murein hydrolase activator NlpD